jgi:hypothetical protein
VVSEMSTGMRANGAIAATTRLGQDQTIMDWCKFQGWQSMIENKAICQHLEGPTTKRKGEASNS